MLLFTIRLLMDVMNTLKLSCTDLQRGQERF